MGQNNNSVLLKKIYHENWILGIYHFGFQHPSYPPSAYCPTTDLQFIESKFLFKSIIIISDNGVYNIFFI